MSRAAFVLRAQKRTETGMVDTCTIRRKTGETTDSNGDVANTYADLYAGKCRVQQHQATADRQDIGEDNLLLLRVEVQLPMSVTGLEVGDEITIVTSASDPDLPGRVFRIHDLAHKTDATARRVQAIERTG